MSPSITSQVNSNQILFVENKEIYEHYVYSKTIIGLKRIWVEGGDPSWAGNF